MKLTASAAYIALAKGDSKILQWRVYARKVTDISLALTGTWTELTDHVDWEKFSDITSRLEYETGQSTLDKIKLTGKDIAWWKANIFNAAANEYIELKVEMKLTDASDIIPMFAGFVDKAGVTYTELTDVVKFAAYTAEDLGARFAAELVSAQPIRLKVDGTNDGLVLLGLKGIYAIDANIASYVLQPGTHTLTYTSSGTKIRLDDGSDTTISGTNTYTLVNGDGTQKIKIYVVSLPPADADDSVVVVQAGNTLPRAWYKNVQALHLLGQLYAQLGITTVTYDTMEMATFDGNPRVLEIDTPPNDINITGAAQALATDGTDLFVAVGGEIYKRTMTTGVYIHLASFSVSNAVHRMWYNARNSHLWIYYDVYFIRRLHVGTLSLSSAVPMVGGGTNWMYSVDIIDYNYTGSSYKYGINYGCLNTGAFELHFIDGGSLIDTNLAPASSGAGAIHAVFYKGAGKVWYKINASPADWYQESVNGSGAWVDDGVQLTGVNASIYVAYSASANRIYYQETGSGDIKSYTPTDGTPTTHLGSVGLLYTLVALSDGNVYCTEDNTLGDVWKISGTSSAVKIGTGALTKDFGLTFIDRLYGVIYNPSASRGKLFQDDDTVIFIIKEAAFTDVSVTDALRQTLKAFNLIGTISAAKKAFVYRRGNDSGTPQTTGNTLAITISEASGLEETVNHFSKCDFVKVTNDTNTITYNGTAFNVAVLSDKRTLSLSNTFIPSSILKDIAVYLYKFFNVNRNYYLIPLGNMPLFQYEPFDNCSITFATTKIQKTGSGPIYAATYRKGGTMEIEVLL